MIRFNFSSRAVISFQFSVKKILRNRKYVNYIIPIHMYNLFTMIWPLTVLCTGKSGTSLNFLGFMDCLDYQGFMDFFDVLGLWILLMSLGLWIYLIFLRFMDCFDVLRFVDCLNVLRFMYFQMVRLALICLYLDHRLFVQAKLCYLASYKFVFFCAWFCVQTIVFSLYMQL